MVLPPLVMVLSLWYYRNSHLMGVPLPVAVLPGLLTLQVTMISFSGVLISLLIERDDGTLQRARTLPRGTAIFATGHAVHHTLSTLLGSLLLVPVFFFVKGFEVNAGVLLVGVLVGLLLCTSWALILGSIVRSGASSVSAAMTPFVIVLIVSGLVVPLSMCPDWMKAVGQVSPLFWLGQLFRMGMLPDSAGVLEVAGRFRPGAAAANLAVWTGVGVVLAPILLKRLTRRAVGTDRGASTSKSPAEKAVAR